MFKLLIKYPNVQFDLNGFTYEPITDSVEIKAKIRKRIKTILSSSEEGDFK